MEEIKMKMQEYVGTRDHNKMYNRDLAKQHPIKAIEGLEEKIAELEEYHVYLYNRIGELKQIMEQEKLSLQNITDAEQAAKLNILTTQNTASNALGITRDEAMTQIRVAGDAAVDKLEEQETAMQDLLTITSSKAEEAEGYAREAESYAEAAQVDVETLRAEKVGFEDYATASKGGVVKVGSYSTDVLDGKLASKVLTNAEYDASGTRTFVSKGTLENVLNERLKEPQFELIEEITLTEDAVSIERTAEPNGTPYRFIAIKVIIDTGKATNVAWTAIRARFDSSNDFEWVGEIPQTSQYSILTLKKEFGKYTFSGSTSRATTVSSPVYSEYYNIANNDYVMINGVLIQRTSNAYFNSGTNIKIYAVRG